MKNVELFGNIETEEDRNAGLENVAYDPQAAETLKIDQEELYDLGFYTRPTQD